MHELSIALSIINLAIKEAEKSNATRVSELEIGEMAGVNIEALEFSMSIAMQNTILEGAKVRIVEIRSLAVCRDCKTRFSPVSMFDPCPRCYSHEIEFLRGRELRLKSLLIE